MVEERHKIGRGKHRLGAEDKYLLSVKIPKEQHDAMYQLRIIKGVGKSDLVTVALDLFLELPVDEIERRVQELRRAKGSNEG